MYRVIECKRIWEKRAFTSLGEPPPWKTSHGEKVFSPVRLAVRPENNPLLRRFRHVLLLLLRKGRPHSRLLLIEGGDAAWFSCLYLGEDKNADGELFAAAKQIAAEWGKAALRGPMSPDGSGFGLGLPQEDGPSSAPWHPQAPAEWLNRLRTLGFEEEAILAEMAVPIAEHSPFYGAEEWTTRHGCRTELMSLANRQTCREIFASSPDAWEQGYDAFARVIDRCASLAPCARALVVRRDGNAAGWALLVPEGERLRILHIQVGKEHRGGPCALALLSRIWRIAEESGKTEIRASTIDLANFRSKRMAEGAGMAIVRKYCMERCSI